MTTTAAVTASPEELDERFASCVDRADLDGIVGLYAADAVVTLPGGREAAGAAAIRVAYAAALDAGTVWAAPASTRVILSGPLALTSSTAPDGSVTTAVARCGPTGSWVWVRDGSRLRDVTAAVPLTHVA